jgi:hypothetical protein
MPVTTDTKSGPWTTESGYVTIAVDVSPDGMVWDNDRQRAIPAVVMRMPGFVADGYAEVFADWSKICGLVRGERREDDIAEVLGEAAEHAIQLAKAADKDHDQ